MPEPIAPAAAIAATAIPATLSLRRAGVSTLVSRAAGAPLDGASLDLSEASQSGQACDAAGAVSPGAVFRCASIRLALSSGIPAAAASFDAPLPGLFGSKTSIARNQSTSGVLSGSSGVPAHGYKE